MIIQTGSAHSAVETGYWLLCALILITSTEKETPVWAFCGILCLGSSFRLKTRCLVTVYPGVNRSSIPSWPYADLWISVSSFLPLLILLTSPGPKHSWSCQTSLCSSVSVPQQFLSC